MNDKRTKIVRTTTWSAGPGCHGGCGVLAHIRDGKLIKLEGDPDHPWNRGRLCARALAMTQYVDHPDRLRHPLKRVGKRGEGRWEKISWEAAFDLIERQMNDIREAYGPESMLFNAGTGRDIYPWLCMLAYAYGSPNVMFGLSGNACYGPRLAAVNTVQGDYAVFDAAQWFPDRYDDPRFKVPECMIVWGYNIHATCPDNLFGHWIIDLMKKGTRIISVDPRLSWFASRAKHHLPLRPGTDAALAMGFLNVIINEDLYDHDFVENWTNGAHLVREDTGKLLRENHVAGGGSTANFVAWDPAGGRSVIWDSTAVAYRDNGVRPMISGKCEVLLADGKTVSCRTVWDAFCDEANHYPPDKVAAITRVPAKDIARAARFYATSKPAAIHWGVAVDMTPALTPLVQAISCLWALTGNLDVPGGNVTARLAFDVAPYALPGSKGAIRLKSPDLDKPRIGIDRYMPINKFYWRAQTDLTLDQIFTEDPYPIKGMWIQTAGILQGLGMDPKRWRQALQKLDFIVAVDLFHTPTTQYADVVLPAGTFLEKDSFRSWWVPLQSINKAITVKDCRSDVEINFELARRFDPDFAFESIHDLFDDILKPSGMTFGELQQKGWAFPPDGSSSCPYLRHEKGLLRPDKRPGFRTPQRPVRAVRHPSGGMGSGAHAPPRGTPLYTGEPPGPGRGVSPDPVHGPAVSGIFPYRTSKHSMASGYRPRSRGGNSPPNGTGKRHRQRRVDVGGKLDGPGQVQGQGHPGGSALDGHGGPRVVVSGKTTGRTVAFRGVGVEHQPADSHASPGQGRHGSADQTPDVQGLQGRQGGGKPWPLNPSTDC